MLDVVLISFTNKWDGCTMARFAKSKTE